MCGKCRVHVVGYQRFQVPNLKNGPVERLEYFLHPERRFSKADKAAADKAAADKTAASALWRTKESHFQPLVKMVMKTVDKNIDKKNKQ